MNIPENAKELFAVLADAVKKQPEEAKQIGFRYLFKIAGEDGGSWTIDCSAEVPSVKSGEGSKPDSTIEINHEDFKKMLATPAAGMELYFDGKLRVMGDPVAATKLHRVFSLIK